MTKECALITGASSGIGEALAGEFADGGFDLVLVARSEDKLKRLARALKSEHGVRVRVEPADLSRRGAPAALAKRLREAGVDVTALVNNAGILEQGLFVDMPKTSHQRLLELNVTALTGLISEFLPVMVERGQGRLLNVASIAAFQPVPSLAVYAATKAYVLSLTESLSEELVGTGVSATALCPGITATNMVAGIKAKNEGLVIPDFVIGDAADVARRGFKACMKGEVVCVPGAINQASVLSSRTTPRWLLRRVTGAVGRYVGKKR